MVSAVAVIGIFLSNIPEGLSNSAGMKRAGKAGGLCVWGVIAVITGIAALIGYVVFSRFSDAVVGATSAVAAGAILAMLADTMIPEAVEEAHAFIGLMAVTGFLIAFVLAKVE